MVRLPWATRWSSLSISARFRSSLRWRSGSWAPKPIAFVYGRDVDAVEPHLAVLHPGVALGDLGVALAQALHLAPGEDHARLVGVEDVVVAVGALVGRDQLGAVAALVLLGLLALRHDCPSRGEQPSPGEDGPFRWPRPASYGRPVKIQNDGLNLHVDENGDPSAPPILLLHGITSFGGTWDWIVPDSSNGSGCCASTSAVTVRPTGRPGSMTPRLRERRGRRSEQVGRRMRRDRALRSAESPLRPSCSGARYLVVAAVMRTHRWPASPTATAGDVGDGDAIRCWRRSG